MLEQNKSAYIGQKLRIYVKCSVEKNFDMSTTDKISVLQ